MTLIQAKSQQLCFPIIKLFLKKLEIIFGHSQEKRIFKSDGRYLIFCEDFPSELIFFCTFYSYIPFFHSKSKRWKLWGKIYWKLHFLVFPYFLFFKYFPKILKRRKVLVVFSWGIFRLDGIFNHVFWEFFDLLRSFFMIFVFYLNWTELILMLFLIEFFAWDFFGFFELRPSKYCRILMRFFFIILKQLPKQSNFHQTGPSKSNVNLKHEILTQKMIPLFNKIKVNQIT